MSHTMANQILDCRGLACPMPIVKTKKAIDQLEPGHVIEVQATDKGSLADIRGWAQNTGHQYLGTVTEGEVLKHFIRKASPDDVKEVIRYPHVISNEELQSKLATGTKATVLDVREPAEYAFNHILGAVSIPLGELEGRIGELKARDEIFVVCRTGNRSNLACLLLSDKGINKVMNVVPGMSEWNGPVENNE